MNRGEMDSGQILSQLSICQWPLLHAQDGPPCQSWTSTPTLQTARMSSKAFWWLAHPPPRSINAPRPRADTVRWWSGAVHTQSPFASPPHRIAAIRGLRQLHQASRVLRGSQCCARALMSSDGRRTVELTDEEEALFQTLLDAASQVSAAQLCYYSRKRRLI